ncbi:MAG TPA: hypothetical protein PLW26_02565 [Candidatus Mcinerneyibacteriales bacterium]|nr:hypothetical protein [Candidatus Mcinerneyibacteriales bacterium]
MKRVVLILLLLIPLTLSATEFSWNGMFRTRTGDYTEYHWYNVGAENPDTQNMSDYMMRLFTNIGFSDSLKAVWGIEVDGVWGDMDQNRDEINVETKHLYMDFTPDFADMLTVRIGLQPYKDPFGSAIFDEDAVGLFLLPKFESFNLKAGWLQFHNQDISEDRDDNLFVLEGSKDFESFTLGAAFLYDMGYMDPNILSRAMHEMIMVFPYQFDNMWLGFFGKYHTDTMEAGGHFVYNSCKYAENFMFSAEDSTGFFAYLYGKYNLTEKMNVKLHFGYTPAIDYDSDDYTYFTAIKPQTNLYGLEYFFYGPVFDRATMLNTYGDWLGQTVLALNINYSFLYLNAGMIKGNFDNYFTDEKEFGKEIDLGFNYPVTDGLTLSGVYALFMPGQFMEDFYGYKETAHEMAFKLEYKF